MFKHIIAALALAGSLVAVGAVDRADAADESTKYPHVFARWPNKSKVVIDLASHGIAPGWKIRPVMREIFGGVPALPKIKRFGECNPDTKGALCIQIGDRTRRINGRFDLFIKPGAGIIVLNAGDGFTPNRKTTCRATEVILGMQYHRRRAGCARASFASATRHMSAPEAAAFQRAYP